MWAVKVKSPRDPLHSVSDRPDPQNCRRQTHVTLSPVSLVSFSARPAVPASYSPPVDSGRPLPTSPPLPRFLHPFSCSPAHLPPRVPVKPCSEANGLRILGFNTRVRPRFPVPSSTPLLRSFYSSSIWSCFGPFVESRSSWTSGFSLGPVAPEFFLRLVCLIFWE